VGEKLEDLEPFHPERVASRVLGMGDLVGLIEKTQAAFDETQALELQRKMSHNEFTLEDFLEQLRTLRSMGSMKDLLGMMPGASGVLKNANMDERQFVKAEAIITSMTKAERRNFQMINASRQKRIARGSGTKGSDVVRLLKQFAQMQKTMKKVSRMGDPTQMARSLFPGQG
ncbi:MAG: signal recognition particle protein, partial [Deltaproteobacteria bacterium]|nr:signal recognition particle protein [Deltaproteobacteria bacterium]